LRPRPPPRSTLFPYTTLFRSDEPEFLEVVRRARDAGDIATVVPTLPPMLAVKDHVLLIYLPLYRNGLVPETREARLREFEGVLRSEEHTSELQSRENLVCRLL